MKEINTLLVDLIFHAGEAKAKAMRHRNNKNALEKPAFQRAIAYLKSARKQTEDINIIEGIRGQQMAIQAWLDD